MKSFTLIELIFVIIIVALLAVGAKNAIPDNTLINNTKFLYNKILEKRANANSFMADMNKEDENRSVCITFDGDWIRNDENYSKVKFKFSPRVKLEAKYNTICFDYLGRPYKGRVDLINFDNLLYNFTDINITYNKEYKTIRIYPFTGAVEIR